MLQGLPKRAVCSTSKYFISSEIYRIIISLAEANAKLLHKFLPYVSRGILDRKLQPFVQLPVLAAYRGVLNQV